MVGSVVVRVPDWVSEEVVERLVEEFVARLGGGLSIGEVRKLLGIGVDELREDVEVYDVELLEAREKERLP
ncbi:MAG: hypothetical protein DRJ69_03760 [Thermoprotei archaeon]|nr:MAG: hypothetical protein DRJ69_03760 [Thermoprotei archaeon]